MQRHFVLAALITAALTACHFAPHESAKPPSPPGLGICIGSIPRDPIVASTLTESLRRDASEIVRAIYITVADRVRGDDPVRATMVVGEIVRAFGPTPDALLVLIKAIGIKPVDRPGAPTACSCHAFLLEEAARRGADISGIVGGSCS